MSHLRKDVILICIGLFFGLSIGSISVYLLSQDEPAKPLKVIFVPVSANITRCL